MGSHLLSQGHVFFLIVAIARLPEGFAEGITRAIDIAIFAQLVLEIPTPIGITNIKHPYSTVPNVCVYPLHSPSFTMVSGMILLAGSFGNRGLSHHG